MINPVPTNGAATRPAPATKPAAPAKRMTLESIAVTSSALYKLFIYGVEGIGKSTLAKGAPSPVWLPVESPRLNGIKEFPKPIDLDHVYEAIATLSTGKHGYQTLVIDTVDALEQLIWLRVTNNGATTMAKAAGGFGAGYNMAYEEWRKLLSAFERLEMNVIMIGHCTTRTAPNPLGENYDRYSTKLFETKEAKPGSLIRGWSDAVLFANYETYTSKFGDDKRAKGVGDGARLLHTQWRPGFDAKNRFDMPPTLPLEWEEVEPYLARTPDANNAAVRAAREGIAAALETLSDAPPEKFNRIAFDKALTAAGDDPSVLARLLERLNSKIAIAGQAQASQAAAPGSPAAPMPVA